LEDPNGGPNNVGIDPAYDDGVVTQDDIVQINHYYPFGLNMEGDWNGASGKNKYQYNGKEWNDDFGLGWNHHDWRFLDVALNRFVTVDPESETGDQQSWNPYHFGYDNPIRYNDPDGRIPPVAIALVFLAEVAEEAYIAYRTYRTVTTVVTTVGAVSSLPSVAVPIELQNSTRTQRSTVQRDATTTQKPLLLKNDENKKGNTSNGNKNGQHSNQKARDAAEKRYKEARQQYEERRSQSNKTPENKKELEQLKKQMNKEKEKMDNTGENHSQKHKGPK
jgi:RHS repeat-associated protein